MSSSRESQSASIAPQEAAWLLSNFALLNQRTVDTDALACECISPLIVDDLCRIGAKLDLVISSSHSDIELDKVRLPLAVLAQKNTDGADEAPSEWLLVLQVGANGALVARVDGKAPQLVPVRELEGRMAGLVLRCTVKIADSVDADEATAATRKFGFGWFVPELLKHKKIWREVLIASLVLQLMALAFPLFTQAIIDKVVVHRTQSTLIALAIGMAVFIVSPRPSPGSGSI